MTMVNMETEYNRAALLNNNEKAARGWNHDGFVSRMTDRMEKVRRLVKDKGESATISNNKNNMHIM